MSPAILPDDPVHVDRWVFFGRDPRPGEVVELSPKNETARQSCRWAVPCARPLCR